MAEIEIQHEREGDRGWQYQAVVCADGRRYELAISLSFSDYDLWSRGRVPPERVVQAALTFLLTREGPESILSKFDCSVIRRYFPQVDRELPELL